MYRHRLYDMRKTRIAPGEHYHIFNRGNNKQPIFLDDRDRIRFLFLLLHLQAPIYLTNHNRQVNYFVKHSVFNIFQEKLEEINKHRYVELKSFALMPNHFHLIVFESKDGGIAQYMQRVLNAYTKYFNAKYQKIGHLFQGPFKAVHVEDNRQLLYLSAYIHRNPREILACKNKEHVFSWSSYSDYINTNRWDKLLKIDIVRSQFSSHKEYKRFVQTSSTKEKEILDKELCID